MKHEPIHTKCEECHQIIEIGHTDNGLRKEFQMCRLFPNPIWIWENRFCPEKTRHESYVPPWFRLDKSQKGKDNEL